jgi:Ca2+-binding EF-hand superfamily protein
MTKQTPWIAAATAAATLMLLPATLHAQSSIVAQVEARFKAADTNKDGKLSKAEAKAKMPRIYSNFDRIDADKDGLVTLDQIKAAVSAAQR